MYKDHHPHEAQWDDGLTWLDKIFRFNECKILRREPENQFPERKIMAAHISIKLFATLNKYTPNKAAYPIRSGTTIGQVLDELKVPRQEAKLIFIDSLKGSLDSVLKGGERVGIFPPIGGG